MIGKHPTSSEASRYGFLMELSCCNLKTTTSAALAFCLGILALLLCAISFNMAFLQSAAVSKSLLWRGWWSSSGCCRAVIPPGWLPGIAGCLAGDMFCTPFPPSLWLRVFSTWNSLHVVDCCNLRLSSSLDKVVFL